MACPRGRPGHAHPRTPRRRRNLGHVRRHRRNRRAHPARNARQDPRNRRRRSFLRVIDMLLDIDAAIIATVVPASLFDLRMFCRKYLKSEAMVIGDADVDLGISVQVDRPNAVGADRLVNAIAAHEAYKGPLIVVDFGTATTFDIVGANGDYEGGVIAPGANLSAEALHQAAAMLPRVAVQRTQSVIGKDNVPAMQSGLYWGYLGLIEGLVAKIKEEYGAPMSVI